MRWLHRARRRRQPVPGAWPRQLLLVTDDDLPPRAEPRPTLVARAVQAEDGDVVVRTVGHHLADHPVEDFFK
jgi:hypothetical protein